MRKNNGEKAWRHQRMRMIKKRMGKWVGRMRRMRREIMVSSKMREEKEKKDRDS
jgi:hypothetical protein